MGWRVWVAAFVALMVVGLYGDPASSSRFILDPIQIMDIPFSQRLILVETDGFHNSGAKISVYGRSSDTEQWAVAGLITTAEVGKSGLGWGHTFRHLAKPGEPIKLEGDKRAPAGLFRLGRPFGLVSDDLPSYMQLNKGKHFCVDDVKSERYSQIVDPKSVPDGTSGEKMWEIGLYKRGIVVDYPTDRKAKSGSCIFLHVWKARGTPTVGCVAADEGTVEQLQKWVSGARDGAWIAIVPKGARDRLGLNLTE